MILIRNLTVTIKAKSRKFLHVLWRRLRPIRPTNPAFGMTDCSSLDMDSVPSPDQISSVVAEAESDQHGFNLNPITTAQNPLQDSHDPIRTILAINALLYSPYIDIDPIVKPLLLAARADLKRLLSLDTDMENIKEVQIAAIHMREKFVYRGPLSNADYKRMTGTTRGVPDIFGLYWIRRERTVYEEKVRTLEERINKLKNALVSMFQETSRAITI
jgi:hypothetical protein